MQLDVYKLQVSDQKKVAKHNTRKDFINHIKANKEKR